MRNKVLDDGRRRFISASILAVPGAVVVSTGLLASGKALSAQTRIAGPVKQPAVVGYPNKKGLQIERVSYPARNTGTMVTPAVAKLKKFFDKALR